jgi:hypothetical protein
MFIVAQPQNLCKLGPRFYNVFCHIGAGQCISGEKSENLVTRSIDAHSTEAEVHRACPQNVGFSASTIAWEESLASPKTTSTVISRPLEDKEKKLLEMIAEETMPVHIMTEDELSFAIEKTGHFENVGFVNGEFFGTDYTGKHLDSDKKVAVHFVVRLSEFGTASPEIWNSPAGARCVVESKVKERLPDARVRVKEVETGLFSVQVVVDAEN